MYKLQSAALILKNPLIINTSMLETYKQLFPFILYIFHQHLRDIVMQLSTYLKELKFLTHLCL